MAQRRSSRWTRRRGPGNGLRGGPPHRGLQAARIRMQWSGSNHDRRSQRDLVICDAQDDPEDRVDLSRQESTTSCPGDPAGSRSPEFSRRAGVDRTAAAEEPRERIIEASLAARGRSTGCEIWSMPAELADTRGPRSTWNLNDDPHSGRHGSAPRRSHFAWRRYSSEALANYARPQPGLRPPVRALFPRR